MTCPNRGALAALLMLAVVLIEAACRAPRLPDTSDEVAEARAIVDGLATALPLARMACPALPRPDVCTAAVQTAARAAATVEPLLVPCPDDKKAPDPTDRYLCEAERVEAVRKALPDLRAAAEDVAALVRGEVPPVRPAPSSSASAAPAPPAASSATTPEP